ncbi:ABC transporter substrate-binding protein [Microbacterium sp. RD1]|uniref:ABC transporter substrate-binding protein n=1 Tax=Microbacterium sp. RD1 TaxID=3457313 RepID=UPI003FA52F17
MSNEVLKVGAGAARFNWLPVFAAERLGYLAEAGIDLEVVRTGAVDKATRAVLEGRIDLAITPPEGAIRNALDGGPLRIVAGNTDTLPLTLVSRPERPSIASLRGARLGTSSLTEGTALYTMEMLRAHGLEYPGDYEFAVVGVHPARWAALQAGDIDAAVQPPPLSFVAIDAGYHDLGEVSDYVRAILFTSVIANLARIEGRDQTITTFLRAVRLATVDIYAGAADSLLATILVELGEATEEYARLAVDYLRGKRAFAAELEIPAAALATSALLMTRAGLLSAAEAERADTAVDRRFLAALTADSSAVR